MDWMGIYGHNIFIDDALVGYISDDQTDGNAIIFISGKKFATLSSEGDILMADKKVGLIDDGGDVYLNHRLVGEVDAENNLRFYGDKLSI